jgi:hypothetical protein
MERTRASWRLLQLFADPCVREESNPSHVPARRADHCVRALAGVLPDTLVAALLPWLGSSALLLGLLALLGSVGLGPGATPAEMDFIIGAGTVVGGWRLVAAGGLPP